MFYIACTEYSYVNGLRICIARMRADCADIHSSIVCAFSTHSFAPNIVEIVVCVAVLYFVWARVCVSFKTSPDSSTPTQACGVSRTRIACVFFCVWFLLGCICLHVDACMHLWCVHVLCVCVYVCKWCSILININNIVEMSRSPRMLRAAMTVRLMVIAQRNAGTSRPSTAVVGCCCRYTTVAVAAHRCDWLIGIAEHRIHRVHFRQFLKQWY